MRFRKLRIAFSATCLIGCVLLVVLWVRSLARWGNFHGHLLGNVYVVSNSIDGHLSLGIGKFVGADTWEWATITASEPAKRLAMHDILGHFPNFRFGISTQ